MVDFIKIIKKFAWKYLTCAAVVVIFHKILFTLLKTAGLGGTLISFYEYGSLVTFLLIWTTCVLFKAREIRYTDLTGRDFLSDHKNFHKDYWELSKYFSESNPYKINPSSLPVLDWKDAEGVILGHSGDRLVKRDSDGVGNLACFGLPGSHKTTSQIIPTALRFGGSVLCIDIKGDVLHWTKNKRKIKIFHPEDATHSCHFNLFEDVSDMTDSDLRVFVESVAFTILPDVSGKEDNYFISGGRDFFCGIALEMLHKDKNATLPNIIDTILTGNAFDFCKSIAAGNVTDAQIYTNAMIGANEKNIAGCFNTLCKAIRPLTNGALRSLLDGKGDCISAATLEAGYDVYIEIPQDKIQVYASLTTLIVQTFMSAFMRRADNASGISLRPIIFLLDEFPQLQFNYDTLSQALSTLRSKGVSLFLAQQSIAQIEGRYGEANCRAIIDTCAYISIMSAQDPRSREFFQALIGRERVLKKTTSQNAGGTRGGSYGESIQEAKDYIYEAADFGNLGEDVVIYAGGKYIQCQKTNCWE